MPHDLWMAGGGVQFARAEEVQEMISVVELEVEVHLGRCNAEVAAAVENWGRANNIELIKDGKDNWLGTGD